jgi:hypothetical protein
MAKDKTAPKVNLTLLKRLVSELETTLESAEEIAANKTEDNVQNYIVEMSKCTGLAAGIMQEATMLVGDIQQMVKINTMPGGGGAKEDLSSLLAGLLKGGSGGGLPGAN